MCNFMAEGIEQNLRFWVSDILDSGYDLWTELVGILDPDYDLWPGLVVILDLGYNLICVSDILDPAFGRTLQNENISITNGATGMCWSTWKSNL